MFRRIKTIEVPSPDGQSVIRVPKKQLYEPLVSIMDWEQVPEFLKKFQDYAKKIGLEELVERRSIFKLMDKLNDPECNFLKELNRCTDSFGRVDWETFLP